MTSDSLKVKLAENIFHMVVKKTELIHNPDRTGIHFNFTPDDILVLIEKYDHIKWCQDFINLIEEKSEAS